MLGNARGIAHEPGGPECKHMMHLRHPLERLDSLKQFQAYPWPAFDQADWSFLPREVAAIQTRGLAAQVWMECTIWETAWYLRRRDLLLEPEVPWENVEAYVAAYREWQP
jgi:uroporphyrinogen decarboxylase